LESQIEPDGKQPLELERTAALGYSTFNLQAWAMLANIAAYRKADIWHYTTKDGRSISKAIDYLVPYVIDKKQWPYQQINPYKASDFYRVLVEAAYRLKDDKYKKLAEKIQDSDNDILIKIFYQH